MTQDGITLTESAARRVRHLIDGEGNPAMMLRISVSGGGCSGFQYGFALDDRTETSDRLFEQRGVRVVVDEVSLDLLRGAELDFVESLMGSAFFLRNPNATSTCGCGSSFSA
ncbi:MAG: iron-sulfur cluster insertion protein ErpA [Alphaproteobacteria bacterium]